MPKFPQRDESQDDKIPYKDYYFSGKLTSRQILKEKLRNDRKELARIIESVTPISFAEALQAVDAMFLAVVALLLRDGHVRIRDFGEFYLHYVDIKKLNPSYKNHIRIRFKPFRRLRERVNHDDTFRSHLVADLDLLRKPIKKRYLHFNKKD